VIADSYAFVQKLVYGVKRVEKFARQFIRISREPHAARGSLCDFPRIHGKWHYSRCNGEGVAGIQNFQTPEIASRVITKWGWVDERNTSRTPLH